MTNQQVANISQPKNLISQLAQSANLDPVEFKNVLMKTAMPSNVSVSEEQFTAFLMVAKKYDLNPITKEIYAFPSRGGIQPIVSIDGWLKIINSHVEFDGMEFKDAISDGRLISVTCKIFRKDRSHPIEVTEYMEECADKSGKSEPWKRWPARMLRHKAAIQAARYAFGFSGIYDPDEGERIALASESDEMIIAEKKVDLPDYTDEQFQSNFPAWQQAVIDGKTTPERIIGMVSSKYTLTEKQLGMINGMHVPGQQHETATPPEQQQAPEQRAPETTGDADWLDGYENG